MRNLIELSRTIFAMRVALDIKSCFRYQAVIESIYVFVSGVLTI